MNSDNRNYNTKIDEMAFADVSSQRDPKAEEATTNSLHQNNSNISLGEVSVDHLRQIDERDAVGNSSKEFMNAPEERDLLSRFQVFCVIANRMIGTGIFESPTSIIQQNRNVGVSILLWLLGCIATMAGTLMYVEFGLTIPRRKMNGEIQAVPRSGGELNYLKYLAKHPKFIAICMFGFIFVVVGNSAANCVSFGVHVLAAAGNHDPKKGVVQAIALAAAWLVTLLHALGRMFGIHLNSAFAVTKVTMLLMIIILGFMVLNSHTDSMPRDPGSYTNLDTATSFKHLGNVNNGRGFASAYLNIIFTFGGWNQANYILGEIRKPTTRFKGISLWSVGIMSILYFLTNIAYMIVVPMPPEGDFEKDNSTIVGSFFIQTIGKAWNNAGALRLMNACLAVSSLGNVIVTTFTAARVKQELAKEGILPWSLQITRNINLIEWATKKLSRSLETNTAQDDRASTQEDNISTTERTRFEPIPLPALGLHCIFSTILILASIRIPKPSDAYPFLVGMYSYNIDAMVAICLSFGMICMRIRPSSKWNQYSDSNRWVSLIAACIVFCANLFPVAALWIPPKDVKSSVPWYMVPTIGWALVLGGFFYFLGFRFVFPLFLKGAVLEVKRDPVIGIDDEGHFIQHGEMVYQKWSVPEDEDMLPHRRKFARTLTD